MHATWIPTDDQLTEAAWYAARRQDRREARRDRERRARLTVWRGSTGRDEDGGGFTKDQLYAVLARHGFDGDPVGFSRFACNSFIFCLRAAALEPDAGAKGGSDNA